MTKIAFEFAGLSLLEPMAFILNWLMAIQSLTYYIRLRNWGTSSLVENWRWFFLFFAISCFCGGIGHLFFNYTGWIGKSPGWLSGIIAISFMEYGMASISKGRLRKFLRVLITTKLLLAMTWISFDYSFEIVIIHSCGMVLFLLIPSIVNGVNKKFDLNYFFLGGLSLIATLPFKLGGIDLHLWFNRDDIGHVFMMFSTFCFFKGAKAYSLQYEGSLSKL